MRSSLGSFVRRPIVPAGCLLTCILAGSASADIASVTGAMTPVAAPVSLLEGDLESSSTIAIIDEGVKVLPADIEVNAFGPGVHDGTAPPLMTITSGSLVHTYIVHFDPVGGGFAALSGSVTFDPGEFIIGVQTHTPLLDAADGPAGDPTVTYPTGLLAFRAFETLPGTDTVTLDPGMTTASFSLFAELGIDQARIVTTVPEPTVLGLLIGAAPCALRRRRTLPFI